MAEIKNTFLKSKMNKDLDERLLPNGEYRDAQNIAISKSEDSNVGAAENIQGTNLVLNGDIGLQMSAVLGVGGQYLKACGQCVDEVNGKLYLFLTNNTDDSLTYQTGLNINHAIVRYDFATGDIFIYSAGKFLNFSYAYKIRNVNLIEDLLFFTDNRNQPRVISVREEFATPIDRFNNIADLAYTTEDHITVCKYAPHKAIDVYKETAPGVFETTMVDASTPNLPAITYAKTALTPVGNIISLDPAEPAISTYLPIASLLNLQVWTDDGQINKTDNAYVSAFDAALSTITVDYRAGGSPTVRFNPLNQDVTLFFAPQNPNFVNNSGVASYPGDVEFLKDKFSRFSYRFKFLNGEFSIMAPFTQPCFIPENFGYFVEDSETLTYESTVVNFMQNQVNKILLQIPMPDDIDGTQLNADEIREKLKISEIEILYKESDGLAVQVVETIDSSDLNTAGAVTTYEYEYQSTEPFKTLPEAQTTRVYDKVPVKAHGQEIISNRVVYSNFQNKHTPPEALDYNVGVSAKFDASTIAAPNNLGDYAFYGYPNHTLKQNRTYQVGIVLSDRYGRTSSVLLSNNQSFVTASATNFGGDTINWPYRDSFDNFTGSDNLLYWPGDSLKVYFNNLINSTKNEQTGTPGLYNGDPLSASYNPLGWYTWKIVVKQKEQEYYNVYLPGILNGHPGESFQFQATDPAYNNEAEIATITLFNDNINKVPRDLSEVGPDQTQYRSSVRFWGRVSPQIYNDADPSLSFTATPFFNKQYYPLIPSDTAIAIGKADQLFASKKAGTSLDVFLDVYEDESNPYLARVSTRKAIGSLGDDTLSKTDPPYPYFLSVYETAPTESRLEIFWETSTSGRVKDLNTAIENSLPAGSPSTLENLTGASNINFKEDRDYTDPATVYTAGTGPIITNDFFPEDAGGATINDAVSMTMVVVDGNGTDVTSRFNLVRTAGTGNGGPATTPNGFANPVHDTFTIQIADYFVYLENSNLRTFQATFNITNTVTGVTTFGISSPFEFSLDNDTPIATLLAPTHWNYNEFVQYGGGGPANNPVISAVNGTAAPSPTDTLELVYGISSQTQYETTVDIFDINAGTGEISQKPGTIMSGPYNIQFAITDANGTGLTTTLTVNWTFGELQVNCNMIQADLTTTPFLQGSDVGGVFWSNKTGTTLPIDYNNNPPAGFTDWVNHVPAPQDPVNISTINTPGCLGQTRSAKSYNASYGPSWCSLSPQGLMQGKWYVTIRLTQLINGYDATLPTDVSAFFKLAIQQRSEPAIAGPWNNAIDLEGVDVNSEFNRGEWLIKYPGGINPYSFAIQNGTLKNTTGVTPTYPTPYFDEMKITADRPQSPTSTQLVLDVTRTFVFDGDNPARRGGYRVMANTLRGNLTRYDSCSASYADDSQVTMSVVYGDFNYPNGTTEIAWQYSVSQVAEIDEESAQNTSSPFVNVYAREPIFRYVTEFYLDPSLTTPWEPDQAGANTWHAYKRRSGAGTPGIYPNPFGDDRAAISNATVSSTQNDRRWIGQFNATGSKVGRSYPTVN